MKIFNTLKKQLEEAPLTSATDIVVAYSGGVDSHVLLHALSQLQKAFGFRLHAIHIHHGLSASADDWLQHCTQVCNSLNVAFQGAKVEVASTSRTSLEASAREARYKKIVELAPKNSQVLLAQHQDDQLETFLLQLKRGAGPKGLSAMVQAWSVQSDDNKTVSFYRPLLAVSQQQVMDYALRHQLDWCEDESNQNTDFERNFLRHDVLPVLQARWPELAKVVSRSAYLCAQQQELLDEVCAEKLKLLQGTNTRVNKSLDVKGLSILSNSWLHQVVRYWLSEKDIQSPSMAVLNRLKPEVLDAAEDANPILQWQGWQFRRFNQQLYVIAVEDVIKPLSVEWTGQPEIVLPNNIGRLQFNTDLADVLSLLLNPADGKVFVNLANYSRRFTPAGAAHSKPLKQWFKLWQVPPWQRQNVIQLVQDEKVMAILVNGEWQLSQQISDQVKGNLAICYLA